MYTNKISYTCGCGQVLKRAQVGHTYIFCDGLAWIQYINKEQTFHDVLDKNGNILIEGTHLQTHVFVFEE